MATKHSSRKIVSIPFMIDTHVHCRDEEQAYKTTIGEVYRIAAKRGIKIIFDMPNAARPIISAERVMQRLELAYKQNCFDGYYVWGGLTSSAEQVEHMAGVAIEAPKVIGLKMYAGKSVGDLTVREEADQEDVYRRLTMLGYTGVIGVHSEKEAHFRMDLWNPDIPRTWSDARPVIAEVESIRDQIRFAEKAGFRGILHICHISTPEGVELVDQARIRGQIRITCGATPQHMLLNNRDMNDRNHLDKKVNPPLRDRSRQEAMLSNMVNGKIDWIETDHATHTKEEHFRLETEGEPMSRD